MWREEAHLTSKLDSMKQAVQKSERNLFTTIARNTSRGLRSVASIVERQQIKGYYGPLYELFTVDESLQSAVEVVAGGSLFHIVVETDDVATKILKVLNEERGGRVTFMPLNRLNPKDVDYPDSDLAVPVLSRLEFEEKFRPAMKQVFGKSILSPTLADASRFARSHKLTGVTFDGDRADKRGAMTGGFIDHRHSRLESIRALQEYKSDFKKSFDSLEKLKVKIRDSDRQILECRDSIATLENTTRAIVSNRNLLVTELSTKQKRLSELENTKSDHNRNLLTLRSSLSKLSALIAEAKKEIGTALTKKLSPSEAKELEKLPVVIDRKKTALKATIQQRTATETKKVMLESEIRDNLSPRLADVEKKLAVVESLTSTNAKINNKQKELESVTKDIARFQESITQSDKFISETEQRYFEESQRLEKLRSLQSESNLAIERQQIVMNKFLTKKSLLVQKKTNAINAIRALGVLPDDAFEKYDHLSERDLAEKLHTVNGSLKKFEGVNRKAYEQYESFTRQKETLEGRKSDLDESAQV